MTLKIDASNKILGRLASEIAILLRGKNKANFMPNQQNNIVVEVMNAGRISVTGNKATKKAYWHYSGYPGGIKKTSYQQLKEKSPEKILWRAVYGMLPKNKLRGTFLRNLIIHE